MFSCIALAALLAIPVAPVLAQSTAPVLEEVWAPSGKTVKLYRWVSRTTDSCRVGYHHIPAGKLPMVHAPDGRCDEAILLKAESKVARR